MIAPKFTRTSHGVIGGLVLSVILPSIGRAASTAPHEQYDPGIRLAAYADEAEEYVGIEEGLDGEYCSDCNTAYCEGACCDCNACNGGLCGKGCLFHGLIGPSDMCFNDFISPMTNPVFFEDPRNLTELRFIFLNHKVPGAAGGGDIQLFAMQIRASLTDRLSLVAAKDGFATSSNPLIDDGWADVALGLKYNLLADPYAGRLLSAGVSFELPVGSTRTLQGNGDGEFHIYLTGGRRIGSLYHWLSASGFRLPTDTVDESISWYWSNHFDRRIGCNWYFFTEFNWFHWIQSGQNGIPGVEGGDLFNFGSTGVAGNDIVTGAFGFKYKPHALSEIGIAWEAPLTDRRDVIDNRLTVDWIVRY